MNPKVLLAASIGASLLFIAGTRKKAIVAPKRSDLLAGLDPSIAPRATELLSNAASQGLNLVITSGFRSFDEQDKLFAQGRTAPGPIVTGVRGGDSLHNYGLAFDVAVVDDSGKPSWPDDSALWNRIGALGKALGLRWGGDFTTPDRTHFELTGGLSLDAIKSGQRPNV